MAESVLDRIVAGVRRRLREEPAPAGLGEAARAAVARRVKAGVRSLENALRAAGPSIIAECKRRSPSAGVLRDPFDPVALARAYEHGGAAAVSVVTEPEFFGGDDAWIPAVREAVRLPVLKKDFIVSVRQLEEAAVLGADAVLLIQRIVSPTELAELLAAATVLRLEVLLEIFVDEDPQPAVASGARILGINARDLATFATRLDRVAEIAGALPAERVRVAESGIHGAAELRRLHGAGCDAFLIGEHLVRAGDPARALRSLLA